MRDFDEFLESLEEVWPYVLSLRHMAPEELSEDHWKNMWQVFCGIRAMASGTSLVGNSKVMAHALSNLVPPIDRQYTLKYLYGHGRIRNGLDREWRTLRHMLEGFFYPVIADAHFRSRAAEWIRARAREQ